MSNKIFRVISTSANTMVFKSKSYHFDADRNTRASVLDTILGEGKGVASFIVDTGHEMGFERHIVLNNGVVAIMNDRKRKMVTKFACSPNRLMKYWRELGMDFPSDLDYLQEVARKNVRMGLTRIYG